MMLSEGRPGIDSKYSLYEGKKSIELQGPELHSEYQQESSISNSPKNSTNEPVSQANQSETADENT